VLGAYTEGQVLTAVALTVGINLLIGSFVTITLPSLIVPFSGLVMGGIRAALWGLLFSPQFQGAGPGEIVAGLLIAVLILLEGQGYVLALLAAYVQGRAFLWPERVGADGHREGYWFGLKQSARIYLLIALVLLVGAVYEVLFTVVALPRLM
jgi:hypothetical protein